MNIKPEVCVHHVPCVQERKKKESVETERAEQGRSRKRPSDLEMEGLAGFATAVESWSLTRHTQRHRSHIWMH